MKAVCCKRTGLFRSAHFQHLIRLCTLNQPTGWGAAEWEAALARKIRVQRPPFSSSVSSSAQPPQREEGETKEQEEEAEDVPALLAQWLPWGYDLYVIGVQESACLKEMRRAVHAYLGTHRRPIT